MRINHNIAALNTYSRLAQATGAQAKSLEKLSSGQRINKAGDDAAGLAISEKMRAQIRGLNQASRNSQDGISMIQTAEGALNETHSILQRMRELAVQSANDTNTTQDRSEIQKEVNQLTSEINRIAGTTEFNKQTLLDGGQAGGSVKGLSTAITKAATDCTGAVYVYDFSCVEAATAVTDVLIASCDNLSCVPACITEAGFAKELANIINTSCTGWKAEAVGAKLTISAVDQCATWGTAGNCASLLTFGCDSICYTFTKTEGTNACAEYTNIAFTQEGIKEGVVINTGNCALALWDSGSGKYADANTALACLGVDKVIDIACYDGSSICVVELVCLLVQCTDSIGSASGMTLCKIGDDVLKLISCTGTKNASEWKVSVTNGKTDGAADATGITLQIGANTGQTFQVSFEDMTSQGVGVASEAGGSAATAANGKVAYYTSGAAGVENNGVTNQFALDVSTSDKATNAISVIDDAITKVSAERSKLGAYQNRLEHTITNLDTSSENLTAAESRIRDVDMAKEMMEFTKNNILNQAATSMLAQANQQPQGVLKLLG